MTRPLKTKTREGMYDLLRFAVFTVWETKLI